MKLKAAETWLVASLVAIVSLTLVAAASADPEGQGSTVPRQAATELVPGDATTKAPAPSTTSTLPQLTITSEVPSTTSTTPAPASPPPFDAPSSTTTAAPETTTTAATTPPPTTTTTKPPKATTTTTKPPKPTTTTKPPRPTTTTTQPPTTTTAPPPTTTTTEAPSGGYSSSAESSFRSKINNLRGSVGVAALTSDGGLKSYARNWAKHMADTGDFSHSNIGSLLGPWSRVGENIAYGYSVSSMFDGLKNSSGHYNNMVSPNFTHFGVGVYVDGDGRIWTAHVFAS